MAEYIDRQEIIDTINAQRDAAAARKDFIGMSILNYLLDVIKDGDIVPAADVAPVVHGHWVCGCQCSVCGDRHGPYNSRHKPYYNYCPNCGAKMDEEV